MSLPVDIAVAVVWVAVYWWLLYQYTERVVNWWKARHCTCWQAPDREHRCDGVCPHALKQYQKEIEDFLKQEGTTV